MRRDNIIKRMLELESQGKSCVGCAGTCCTYEANSMMVTPLEAVELLQHLKSSGQLDDEFKEKCRETVKRYRLDHPAGNGRRSFLRRTYTCPFFNHKELGCPLPREVKPYGCLAFNAHHPELKAGEHCYSETELLEEREKANLAEVELNRELHKKFNLVWEKTPLPLGLLELWDSDFS